MSYAVYFKYLNETGKITARSLMDGLIICFTFIEELEKQKTTNEANFREIEEILKTLSKKATMEPAIFSTPFFTQPEVLTTEPGFICPICNKELKTKLGLSGHSRSHKNVV